MLTLPVPAYQSHWTTVYIGEALATLRQLPDECCQVIITSPPYWGLRSYLSPDHPDKTRELGTEKVHDCLGWATGAKCGACYICRLVTVFDEVRRVLRPDGVAWVNIADSYASIGRSEQRKSPKGTNGQNRPAIQREVRWGKERHDHFSWTLPGGIKPKDLCGIPQRFALAMQAAGWWWRQDIAWVKQAPMPESVTDRFTSSWEHVLMFTKAERYYFDIDAVAEPSVSGHSSGNGFCREASISHHIRGSEQEWEEKATRRMRNSWILPPEPSKQLHYAAFPRELVRRCLLASTSERGCCPACQSPWQRVVAKEKGTPAHFNGSSFTNGKTHDARVHLATIVQGERTVATKTTGWQPTCPCGISTVQPCVVLDPFAGSGTTAFVAQQHFRRSISIDLNGVYLPLMLQRLEQPVLPLNGARMPLAEQ